MNHLSHLESRFQKLDLIPDELYQQIVTHSHGELNHRISGILQWREAFLLGYLPDEQSLIWPEVAIRRIVLQRIETLEIVHYCKQQPELTDAILRDVCDAITSAAAHNDIDPGFNDKLARQQKQRDSDSPFNDPDDNSQNNQAELQPQADKPVDSQTKEIAPETDEPASPLPKSPAEDSLPPTAEGSLPPTADGSLPPTAEGSLQADGSLEQHWSELASQWQQLEGSFSELSSLLGKGWDLTQGLLASQGWRDIIRYRQLVKNLPWLEQVIASLGRLKDNAKDNISDEQCYSELEKISQPLKRLIETEVEVRSPHAVHETSGVRRSDDISRLLPAELAQLGHPQLNMLWHAKRAEHTLMAYQVDGVFSDHEPRQEEEYHAEIPEEAPALAAGDDKGYGPIMVCLDSSASMQGKAENIAKAIVLEALRIAWQENRACYVYLFSGPEQVLTHQLDLTKGGLAELLNFLTQTFQGGTDVIKPLLQAISRQKQKNWQMADILLLSDGRFPLSHAQKQQIDSARKNSDLRIHGVIIGNWQGRALPELCDYWHRVAN